MSRIPFLLISVLLTSCASEPIRITRSRDVVRVASYNVAHWRGDDGEKDVERIAQMFRDLQADVVVVQEVDNYGAVTGKTAGRQHRLENMVGGRWVAFDDGSISVHRNGVFVGPDVEVIETAHVDVSEPGRDPRAIVDLLVRIRGNNLRIVGAHLGLASAERGRQVDAIANVLSQPSRAHATVVTGDFNEWNPLANTFSPLEPYVREISSDSTFPAWAPMFRLDRFWVSSSTSIRRVQVHHTELAEVASDHLPLVAEIAF